jgi:hypothetical protein
MFTSATDLVAHQPISETESLIRTITCERPQLYLLLQLILKGQLFSSYERRSN